MVFIRRKTNRYVAKDGSVRTYTYGLLVRSHRPLSGAPPVQQVIKYLGCEYDDEDVLANAQRYVDEFEDLAHLAMAFAKKNKGSSAKEFYVRFVEDYLRHNGFREHNKTMVLRDIAIDAGAFSVKKSGKKAHVRVGLDLIDSTFLKDIYARLRSIRDG